MSTDIVNETSHQMMFIETCGRNNLHVIKCFSWACRQAKNCKSNLIIVDSEFSLSMKLAFCEHFSRRALTSSKQL